MQDKKEFRRSKLYIDKKVQGVLAARIVTYWIFCLMGVLLMTLVWTAIRGPKQPSSELFRDLLVTFFPALGTSLVLLPIVLMDAFRVSNRFVGPIYKLRQGLQDLAEGKAVEPISLRREDFWGDVVEAYNAMLERQGSVGSTNSVTSGAESSSERELVACSKH
ncbi:MAG: hypothetical protein R3E01_02875 [Pirellulaceae bacterium]